MAYQLFGRGQVLFLGINSIWRWRYRIGARFTDRFWGQTIQALGLPHLIGNMNNLKIETVGRDFKAAEKIDVNCRLVSDALKASANDSINLIATEIESGETKEFTMPKGTEASTYSGAVVLPEGQWDLQVKDYENEYRPSNSRSQIEPGI